MCGRIEKDGCTNDLSRWILFTNPGSDPPEGADVSSLFSNTGRTSISTEKVR
jgi:hypothetical protein